jgi:hypothetical protein
MLESFDFELGRTASFLAAMNQIATFRPDGRTTANVALIYNTANGVRTAYVGAGVAVTQTSGAVDEAWRQVHLASVSVTAAMRSLYRKDPASLRMIESLPTQDQSRDEIKKRADLLAATWAKLPLPPPPYPVPGGPGPHYVEPYAGMTMLEYLGMVSGAKSLESTVPNVDTEYEKQEGLLHEEEAVLRDFNVAARAQGIAQFTEGWEREVIEAIPTEPPSLPPAKGEITDVEAPGGPLIQVRVTSARASKFRLEGKGPGSAVFVVLVESWPTVRIPCTLPAVGAWTLRVRGENAKGEGEWSDEFEVTVPA